MSQFYKVALGALVALPLLAGQASANIFCLLIPALCQTGGGSGGTTAVPEIDVTQGLAALAIVAVMGLIMREKFLRARA